MAERFDLVVVGAGPGGSSAAYHSAKAGLNTLLLEQLPALDAEHRRPGGERRDRPALPAGRHGHGRGLGALRRHF